MSTSIHPSSWLPTFSPIYNIGASSSSPSPITTSPFIFTDSKALLIASTAAPSAPSLSPLPINCDDTNAAASVTLTSSNAKFLSIFFSFLYLFLIYIILIHLNYIYTLVFYLLLPLNIIHYLLLMSTI